MHTDPALVLTKNEMEASRRTAVVALLNARLADSIDLMLQAKQAHWNVRGGHFISLHNLFDEVHEEVSEYVDLIAERAAQLGGRAEGTVRAAARRSGLEEYPHDFVSECDHVDAVSSALAAFGRSVRKAIHQIEELEDVNTADVLTQISRGTDKLLWFVESHFTAGA